jgi:hypothetical protein
MIYFLEHDNAENICHVCANPGLTIVPLVNIVSFPNLILADPVGIDAATYDTLIAEGIQNFTYDAATKTVVKKPATTTGTSTNAPATT